MDKCKDDDCLYGMVDVPYEPSYLLYKKSSLGGVWEGYESVNFFNYCPDCGHRNDHTKMRGWKDEYTRLLQE